MWTLFKYLYRDAGNYKVSGVLALSGEIDAESTTLVDQALESGEFFIAEQVGAPPLQPLLQRQFGGRNDGDHCWHSFEGWEVVEQCPIYLTPHDSVEQFVTRFAQTETWQECLSPEFGSFLNTATY